MSIGSTTAKSGYKTEELFSELVNKNLQFKYAVKDFLNIPDSLDISASVLKGVQKGDVKITISNDDFLEVSIKKSTADFSQLDRRWLDSLKDVMNMPDSISNKIQCGLDSMRLKQGTIQQLIHPQYSYDIVQYFQNNIMIFMDEMFTRQNNDVSLFVVYNPDNMSWYLLHMKDVLKYVSNLTVDVSNKGVLKFGDCITLQRKGGDGHIKRIPKTDPKHPSNQIQTKIKPLKIVNELNPMVIYPSH